MEIMNRNSNILKQIKWSFLFKILAFIVYYISISYQVKILGIELYGVWATLLSIITWIVFFDFGIGNGIKNHLTKALSLNNIQESKEIIMTGYVAVSLIAICIFFIITFSAYFFNLNTLFNTQILSNNELKGIIIILFLFISIHFIISFVKQFIFAIQKNALNEFEQFFFYTILCLFLIIMYYLNSNDLMMLVIIYGISLIISKIFLTIIFFYKNKNLIPSYKNFNKNILSKLIKVGGAFFLLQLVSMFILLSDKMIITQLLGPSEVSSYDIVYRLFSVILIIHGIINAPMWSAYTESFTKKDFKWIKKNLSKMNIIVFILIFISIFLYFIDDFIIKYWIGDFFIVSNSLSLTMCIYVIVLAWCNNYAFFLNGIDKIKGQFFSLLFGAIINIPLSIYFVKYLNYGSEGVVIATIISLSFFAIIGPIQTYRILKDKKNAE